MLVDSYDTLLEGKIPEEVHIVDMSYGKSNDDGYCGVHLYYQPNYFHHPIEIQTMIGK